MRVGQNLKLHTIDVLHEINVLFIRLHKQRDTTKPGDETISSGKIELYPTNHNLHQFSPIYINFASHTGLAQYLQF